MVVHELLTRMFGLKAVSEHDIAHTEEELTYHCL